MQAILAVTLPFFALVLMGYLAAARGWLPAAAIPGLNGFVLFFALPCMLFRFGQGTPIAQLLSPPLIAVYLASAVLIVFFTIAVTRGPRVPLRDAAFGALVAAFPNTGFMGVPLLVALLGPAAAGPAIATILIDIFITTSACIAIAQAGGDGAPGAEGASRAREALARSLKGAASNPLPWAVALGAAFGAFGLGLPAPVDTIVRMLADAASPVALFTIGAVLWRSGQAARGGASPADHGDESGERRPEAAPWASVAPVAAIKLLLHPLLVFVFGIAAITLGAPLRPFDLMVITLVAALPSASNVSLLAERYRADTGRVARIILASTVFAFATFSLVAFGFGLPARTA
jgi:malonate transporter and related proteins